MTMSKSSKFILLILTIKSVYCLGEKCVDSNCLCLIRCGHNPVESSGSEASITCNPLESIHLSELASSELSSICKSHGRQLTLTNVRILKSDGRTVVDAIQQRLFGHHIKELVISDSINHLELPNKLFADLDHLQTLLLKNNNLTHFNSNTLFSTENELLNLNLDSNQLTSVNFSNLKRLTTLSLVNNQLTSLSEDAFYPGKRLSKLNIVNNTFDCKDQRIGWFFNWIKIDEENAIQNKDQLKCSFSNSELGMNLVQNLFANESSTCKICDCSIKNKDAVSVNCSNRGLQTLPLDLPSNTKIVRMDNNNIKNLTIKLSSFKYWRNVTYLHLNNNTIESLVGLEGTKIFRNLVALHINQNRLTEIPSYILDHLSHLDQLFLSDNPWRCDCNSVPFQNWLQSNFKVKDVENLRCSGEHRANAKNGIYFGQDNIFANRIFHRIPKSELCPQAQEPIDWIDIFNGLVASLIILICFKLVYDYFWQKRTGKLPKFFKLNV